MRRLLTIVTCLLITGLAFADKVSEMEALKKAQAFMPGERFEVQKYSTSVGGKTVEEPFYIFNATNNRGFVLVSAEDRTTPILGYSTNGNIDLDNIPDNLRYWLESYAAQLKAIEEGTPAATPRAKTRSVRENIEPLLSTTWNQSEPYNLMCPDGSYVDYDEEGYNANNRCVTGCVATAVAQVMYFHKWPQQQVPAIPSYSLNRTINIHELPATTFEWNKMKTTYKANETDESAYAVAKLMRYVGQACMMGYTPGSSSAHIHTDMMVSTFGYSKKIHKLDRDGYTTTQWEDMVYNELANNRPVLYSGDNNNGGGHQFVCDGYKDGLFRLNWGWGSWLDGYFVLSIADPHGEQGIGGSTGAYSYGQDAVFNFMPAEENEEDTPPILKSVVNTNISTTNYTRTSANENFTGVSLSGSFRVSNRYIPTTTFSAEVGWGLYQNEQLKQYISNWNDVFDTRNLPESSYYTYSNRTTAAEFGANLPDGKYQLRQIFRKADTNDDWTLMDSYGSNYLVAEINGNTLTVRAWDSSNSVFSVNSISVPDMIMAGESLLVTVNLTNESEAHQQQVSLWAQKDGTTTWTKVSTMTGYVDPDLSGDVVLTYTPETAGTFHLKVTNGSSEESLGETTITIKEVLEWTDESGLKYSYVEGTGKATLIRGDYQEMTSVTIPATITVDNEQYAVKAIGDKAFISCNSLITISMPDGLESIGESAFQGDSHLNEFTIPSKLKSIGSLAFYNCNGLKNVSLPEGLEVLGDYAFAYCFGLQKLELPSTLSSIDQFVIKGCDVLTTVVSHIQEPFQIDDLTFVYNANWNNANQQYEGITPSPATLFVPVGTKSKYQAFTGWKQFKDIEEGEIKEGTFNGLKYSYSTGSKKATLIAGDYESMTTVEIPATVTFDDGITCSVTAIGNQAFYYCRSLNTISLPDGIESIGDRAFQGDYYMNEFAIPSTLKNIGKYAFYNCNRLKNVILPEGLETLGESAFEACFGLNKLILPSTLSSIGEFVIKRCNVLTTVESHIQNPLQVDDLTFVLSATWSNANQQYEDLTPSPATLYVPKGKKNAYQAITGWTMFQSIEEMAAGNGDTNSDGDTDTADAVNTLSYILGDNPTNFNAAAADINGDGIVTVTDIILMFITYILIP